VVTVTPPLDAATVAVKVTEAPALTEELDKPREVVVAVSTGVGVEEPPPPQPRIEPATANRIAFETNER
jgi:hypothetical protein